MMGTTMLQMTRAMPPTDAAPRHAARAALLAPLLARVRARDPLNVPDESRGTARPGETTS